MVSSYAGVLMKFNTKVSFLTWLKQQLVLFSKFGAVGVIAALFDVAIFNLFVGGLRLPPIEAKILSGLISTVFAWVGNRYWTFREQRRSQKILELFEYLMIAGGGLLISLFCLWISHYVLGFKSLLADNISGNFVGLILATLFRYFGNQYWVFGNSRKHNDSTMTVSLGDEIGQQNTQK